MCSIMGIQGKNISEERLLEGFERTISRGPDMSRVVQIPSGYLCFHRLAIMGLTPDGMQPFQLGETWRCATGRYTAFARCGRR